MKCSTPTDFFSWSGKLLLAGWLVVSPSPEIIKKGKEEETGHAPRGPGKGGGGGRKLVRFLGNTEEEEEAVATKEGTARSRPPFPR